VHSTAPVLMSTWASKQVGRIPAQVDKMGLGLFPNEQIEYFRALVDWQTRTQGQVMILGGDMHFGIETDILVPHPKTEDNDKVVLRQIVSSAISNNPPPYLVYWGLIRAFLKSTPTIGEPTAAFKFHHTRYFYGQNFADFDANIVDGKGVLTGRLRTSEDHLLTRPNEVAPVVKKDRGMSDVEKHIAAQEKTVSDHSHDPTDVKDVNELLAAVSKSAAPGSSPVSQSSPTATGALPRGSLINTKAST